MDDRIKDRNWWEEYFIPEGGWERNRGRSQTRIFAEYATPRMQIDPKTVFSILDAGCALGDAIKHFAKVYPRATIHGIDFSDVAIERCKKEIGDIAKLFVCDLEEIDGSYDVIYCSNTLEHFSEYDVKTKHLINHCERLCILVPFMEFNSAGKPLTPNSIKHHQHTFMRDSFDFLVNEGLADNIQTHIFSCPGAWGWTLRERLTKEFANAARVLGGRHRILPPRQIMFDITKRDSESTVSS